MISGPVVHLEGVAKHFGDVRALDGMSFELPKGATCAILGHNGAGKTTTIRAMLGLLAVDAGTVRVLGLDPLAAGRAVRARVGVLLDHDGLYDRMSAIDNLDYHARIHGLDGRTRATRIEEVLRLFELWDRRRQRVRTWSTGMRKKLAIARALLHRPELLVLDEPFAGLDPVAAAELRTLLAHLAANEGMTVIVTTHDLAHVERACSHVIVADHGRVIATGTLEELQRQNGSRRIVIAGAGLDEAVLTALIADGLVETWEASGAKFVVVIPSEARSRLGVELVRRGVALEELHPIESSLEDIFLSLVRGGAS
jgi:ABC-2 type transport system ATP-binding protein